jgi:hypothetical protein
MQQFAFGRTETEYRHNLSTLSCEEEARLEINGGKYEYSVLSKPDSTETIKWELHAFKANDCCSQITFKRIG